VRLYYYVQQGAPANVRPQHGVPRLIAERPLSYRQVPLWVESERSPSLKAALRLRRKADDRYAPLN